MKINNLQSPNFGKVTIHESAHKIFEQMPDSHITQMFEQAASIQKTQYWDLFVKEHEYPKQFYMYFINKEDPIEYSFVQGLIPFKQEGHIVNAIGEDANPYSDYTNNYKLEFSDENRAKEVYNFLNQPEPKLYIDTFKRAIETIKILEEASIPKPKPQEENQPSFFTRLLNWFLK